MHGEADYRGLYTPLTLGLSGRRLAIFRWKHAHPRSPDGVPARPFLVATCHLGPASGVPGPVGPSDVVAGMRLRLGRPAWDISAVQSSQLGREPGGVVALVVATCEMATCPIRPPVAWPRSS